MLCDLMNSRLTAVNGNRTFKDCTSLSDLMDFRMCFSIQNNLDKNLICLYVSRLYDRHYILVYPFLTIIVDGSKD